ncbi:MAG TPA: LacI family DNA-binding transcriptional regulator [Chthoniobacteraceae bacterium]|nr:LacI family DNA-binding transcriptional regulator [Chthoniobacteraceae bacterium]
MSEFPTLKSIAKACGVSHVTVSRALRGQTNMRPETAARIRSYAEAVGYKTNSVARFLAEGRTHHIAFSAQRSIMIPHNREGREGSGPDRSHLIWDYIQGATEAAASSSHSMELLGFHDASQELQRIRGLVEEERVAGILDFGLQSRTIDYLVSRKIPMVSTIGPAHHIDPRRTAYVYSDHIMGLLQGWRYLVENRHTRIGFVGPKKSGPLHPRLGECRAAGQLLSSPLQLTSYAFIESGASNASIWETFCESFGKPKGGDWPTAIFCTNDAVANRVITAMQEYGVAIPRDLSVLGFDDSAAASLCSPTLTTIADPRKEMGAAMLRILEDIIAGRPGSRSIIQVVPMKLVERESVAPPKGA